MWKMKKMNLRTHKEFMEEMEKSHSCEKSEGKIICIEVDKFENYFCGYCNQKVNYPKPSQWELAFWITMIEDKRLMEELK